MKTIKTGCQNNTFYPSVKTACEHELENDFPPSVYAILLYAIQFKGLPRQTSFRCPTKYYKRKRTPFGGALHWAISIFKFFLSLFFAKFLGYF